MNSPPSLSFYSQPLNSISLNHTYFHFLGQTQVKLAISYGSSFKLHFSNHEMLERDRSLGSAIMRPSSGLWTWPLPRPTGEDAKELQQVVPTHPGWAVTSSHPSPTAPIHRPPGSSLCSDPAGVPTGSVPSGATAIPRHHGKPQRQIKDGKKKSLFLCDGEHYLHI